MCLVTHTVKQSVIMTISLSVSCVSQWFTIKIILNQLNWLHTTRVNNYDTQHSIVQHSTVMQRFAIKILLKTKTNTKKKKKQNKLPVYGNNSKWILNIYFPTQVTLCLCTYRKPVQILSKTQKTQTNKNCERFLSSGSWHFDVLIYPVMIETSFH